MGQRQLKMLISSLEDLPQVVMPVGCEIRTYRTGDEQAWADIMNTGVGDDWTVEKVAERLTGRPQFDPEGLFFTTLNGKPVGTACAWRLQPEERETGTVHMVCVLPEARGRNLGYLVVLQVLHFFRDHGYASADLTTDDIRIPAIKSYLRLGFEPVCIDESDEERWRKVRGQL